MKSLAYQVLIKKIEHFIEENIDDHVEHNIYVWLSFFKLKIQHYFYLHIVIFITIIYILIRSTTYKSKKSYLHVTLLTYLTKRNFATVDGEMWSNDSDNGCRLSIMAQMAGDNGINVCD